MVVQYNSQPGLLDLNLLGTLGSILNSLPLVNAVVADLPLGNISPAFESVECEVHQHRPHVDADAQQRGSGSECLCRVAVRLHGSGSRRSAD